MTTDEKRIKIAEHLGWPWRESPHNPAQRVLARRSREALTILVGRMNYDLAPDYFNDLNAMHEAENTLNFVSLRNYYCALRTLCCPPEPHNLTATECAFSIFIATAAQRAEAFGKTLSLW